MIVPQKKILLRQDEDGVWIAKSDLLPGCHAQGRDRGEATLRFQEAAKVHLGALLETGRSLNHAAHLHRFPVLPPGPHPHRFAA